MLKKMKISLMKVNVRLLSVVVMLVCATLPYASMAQAGFETADGGAGTDTGVTDVPINGGAAFLIAAGVVFGAYRLYKLAQNRISVTA